MPVYVRTLFDYCPVGRTEIWPSGLAAIPCAEDIPWSCQRLVVGSGADGALPVMEDVAEEAKRRGVQLVVLPTSQALEELGRARKDTNAILHVTC